jgi:hypothetical protein
MDRLYIYIYIWIEKDGDGIIFYPINHLFSFSSTDYPKSKRVAKGKIRTIPTSYHHLHPSIRLLVYNDINKSYPSRFIFRIWKDLFFPIGFERSSSKKIRLS